MKPSDVFLGVTDFFSVLLPGCFITWVAYQYELHEWFGEAFSIPNSEIGQFSFFLLVSYAIGHVVFIVSAKIDDLFYDSYREKYLDSTGDDCYKEATRLKAEKVNNSVMNTYKYSQHYIGIVRPDLLIDIKKIEADSKFFRSLIIAFLVVSIFFLDTTNTLQYLCFTTLSFLSFFPYAKLRYKATQKAFEVFITHVKSQENQDKKEKHEQQKTSDEE